jgi:hypothetical protein
VWVCVGVSELSKAIRIRLDIIFLVAAYDARKSNIGMCKLNLVPGCFYCSNA